MTQPQQDPATDVGAALARLAEQTVALQRQIVRTQGEVATQVDMALNALREVENRITMLTDAKFVTYRTLIDSQAEKVALALSAADKAVTKAEVATEKRFDAVNEFRAQLADQARTFMPRTEALQISTQALERIREITDLLPTLSTRLEVQVMTDRYSERIGELNDRLNRMEGQGQGKQENRAGIYGAIGAAVAIIAIVVFVANLLTT